jgi:hypothetical protein
MTRASGRGAGFPAPPSWRPGSGTRVYHRRRRRGIAGESRRDRTCVGECVVIELTGNPTCCTTTGSTSEIRTSWSSSRGGTSAPGRRDDRTGSVPAPIRSHPICMSCMQTGYRLTRRGSAGRHCRMRDDYGEAERVGPRQASPRTSGSPASTSSSIAAGSTEQSFRCRTTLSAAGSMGSMNGFG